MDIEKMNNLLHNKDKVKASKADQEAFFREWLSYVGEHGFDDNAEVYLYGGFSYKGMKPFITYLKGIDDRKVVINRFFSGKCFYKDRAKTFKMTLQLLALLLLNFSEETTMISDTIRKLPELSINKEKKRLADIGKSVEKYFIRELNSDIILPNINELDLRPAMISLFYNMMTEAIQAMHTEENSTPKDLMVISSIERWLQPNKTARNEEAQNEAQDINEMNGPMKIASAPFAETIEVHGVHTESAPQFTEHTREKHTKTWQDGIDILVGSIKLLEREKEILQGENRNLLLSNKSLVEERDKLLNAFTQEQSVSNELRETTVKLNDRINELQCHVDALKNSIEEKNAEITDRIRMVDIISKDSARQSNEVMRRLSSELKSFYSDFADAENLAMTVEIGEIMRDQLQEIFRILQKRGILLD